MGNFFLLYSSNALSTQLLQFAGVLFGLLLTAYAILLSLVPSISKIDKSVLDTDAFKKSHLSFVLALLMTLAMIIVSFSIIFATGSLQQNLIYAQLLLLFFVLELATILTIALGFLFRYVISTAAKGLC